MSKIAGVVIVYYPDFQKLLFNIGTFVDEIEQLFIVFNSPVSDENVNFLNSRHSNIQIVINNENIGIAAALNQTAQMASDLGYDWLLTMDQDSSFKSDQFFKAFGKSNDKNIAIFSPNPEKSGTTKVENTIATEEVLCAITSGNLLNLGIWKNIGGFEEKLFIDEVDNDYCLKAVSNGFKILRFNNIPLIHELGKNKEISFLFRKYTIITHPPVRAYYIFRNNLYMFSRYKNQFPKYIRSREIMLLKVFIKILLFSSERMQNFEYMFNGFKDYFNNSFGPYKEKLKNNNNRRILNHKIL